MAKPLLLTVALILSAFTVHEIVAATRFTRDTRATSNTNLNATLDNISVNLHLALNGSLPNANLTQTIGEVINQLRNTTNQINQTVIDLIHELDTALHDLNNITLTNLGKVIGILGRLASQTTGELNQAIKNLISLLTQVQQKLTALVQKLTNQTQSLINLVNEKVSQTAGGVKAGLQILSRLLTSLLSRLQTMTQNQLIQLETAVKDILNAVQGETLSNRFFASASISLLFSG